MENKISNYGKKGDGVMDINDLKKMKKNSGMTNAEIAELSGIPLSTVNKIFSGATKNPRYATLLAIEQVLSSKEKIPFKYDRVKEEPVLIREAATPYAYSAREYDGEDIEKLSEYNRAELISGKIYMLSAPGRLHQYFVGELLFEIKSFIRKNKGKCEAYVSPFDVRLFGDDTSIVQPDLLVVCNRDILTDKGCCGAPDWVIEIVSKSNSSHDYVRKLVLYQKAGVREYWIVDPFQERVTVVNFEDQGKTEEYTYSDAVPSGVLEGLEIRFAQVKEGY